MRIAMLQVYNEVDWIAYQIDQAVKLCDRLIIIEGSQFAAFEDIPLHSTDGTLDIISMKLKEYDNIDLWTTERKHKNYRHNQCANFNKVLNLCKEGDYFLYFDADEFFADDFIEEMNYLMSEGKIDFLDIDSYIFAFSFDWLMFVEGEGRKSRHVFYKVYDGLQFKPTHRPTMIGPNKLIKKEKLLYHYTWVKPTDRMRLRMKTSGFVPGMLEWFENNWHKIDLIEGKKQMGHLHKYFWLERYHGEHPTILANHPWKNINDIRTIK